MTVGIYEGGHIRWSQARRGQMDAMDEQDAYRLGRYGRANEGAAIKGMTTRSGGRPKGGEGG